ncbi:hypothetical protein [Microlunatus flavus]|uniref:Uncharacterized protein n=1 Tax=Microlunatus flavus TaxID=1036181 RepID=A0A1H9MFZ6_9ACTN|nr:hypothetical protein [Microlunatus flavus]SER22584.1 hypothetical protein SAMN05421756_110115 [Microlunatus flavus]
MATWEDGPEYAPLERPQYFADAPVPPLEQAPPPGRPADGLPAVRPRFDQPSAPVAPLADLVPQPPDERDPSQPFDVVTATLTSESLWTSAPGAWGSSAPEAAAPTATTLPTAPTVTPGHPSTAPTALAAPPTAAPNPAAAAPWPVLEPPPGPAGFPPADPQATQPGAFPHAAPRGPYPEPGTPGWFAPPPTSYGEQPQGGRTSARAVFEAATPGLCICLAIGGVILPLAPVMLVVAVFLATRVAVAQAAVRMLFRIAAGAVAFFAVIGVARAAIAGDSWWGFVSGWSVAICWLSLGVLLLIVWQTLRRSGPPSAGQPPVGPPSAGPWG